LVTCKELVEIELRNNPFLNKNSYQDIIKVLPNIRLIDNTQVEEFKGVKKTETKTLPANPGMFLFI